MRKVLETSQHPHAFVHSVFENAYGLGSLFQCVLQDLSISMQTPKVYGKSYAVSDFIDSLKDLVGDQSAVIIMEGAERLREYPQLQKVFSQLQDITGKNICCVWESLVEWHHLTPPHGLREALIKNIARGTTDPGY